MDQAGSNSMCALQVKRAYQVAGAAAAAGDPNSPFIVTADSGPTLRVNGSSYDVLLKPVGHKAVPKDENVSVGHAHCLGHALWKRAGS